MESADAPSSTLDGSAILDARRRHIGANLSLSYSTPLHIVRGEKQNLYDSSGIAYLDMVNNVAHLGHCHPEVVAAASTQLAALNTNTRYLDANLVQYAKELTALFPSPLSVVYFVNSGSEANELAIRLARAATGGEDIICLDHAYHGNTQTCVDMSPYKFRAKGGAGQRPHIHVAACPDPYRHGARQERKAEAAEPDSHSSSFSSSKPDLAINVTLPPDAVLGVRYAEDVARCCRDIRARHAHYAAVTDALAKLGLFREHLSQPSSSPLHTAGTSKEGADHTHPTHAHALTPNQTAPNGTVRPPVPGRLAAFIAESVVGCAGQIVLPQGFLSAAFRHAREAGGVCILDEVQVGLGRVGEHMWAFQTQLDVCRANELMVASTTTATKCESTTSTDSATLPLSSSSSSLSSTSSSLSPIHPSVIPDIVTLGKPLGNGWPLGAVVTTPRIAEAFANGMEYFNTFGGSTASCAVGRAVLRALKEDKLRENAREMGVVMMKGLREVQQRHVPLVGDVRGLGLFIGVELVRDEKTLEAADWETSYVVDYAKNNHCILLSTDGPLHNVIKIKPPLCITGEDADRLVRVLDEAFTAVEAEQQRRRQDVAPLSICSSSTSSSAGITGGAQILP